MIKELISNGVNINKPDRVDDGYGGAMKFYPTSPLKAAVQTNNLEIVTLLVENRADINQADGGHTPMKTAKNDSIKEYLILKGAK